MMNNNGEIWIDLPGYVGIYKISDFGKIKTLARSVEQRNRWGTITIHPIKERILKGSVGDEGYTTVELVGPLIQTIHRLVLFAFIGPCPAGMYARHKDGNPSNNRLDNLEWATPTTNNRDKITHGTMTRGSSVNTSRLKEHQVIKIRRLMIWSKARWAKRRPPLFVRNVAARYGVSRESLYAIEQGSTWKHLWAA